MACVPPVSDDVVHVATPAVREAAAQPLIVVPLSVNATVPERATAALEGLTVAVKVTD